MTDKAVLHCLSVLVTASFVVDFKHTCRQHVDYYGTLMIVTTDSLFQLGSVSFCSQQMECRVDTPNIVFAKQKKTQAVIVTKV